MRLQAKARSLQEQAVKGRFLALPPVPFKSQQSTANQRELFPNWMNFWNEKEKPFLKQHYTQLITLSQIPKY